MGVQALLLGESREQCIWKMFLAWDGDLLFEDAGAVKKKKLFWYTIAALDCFIRVKDTILKGWAVAEFNGKPASELGYSIDFGDGFYERGFVDIVLYHAATGRYMILELKTKGSDRVDEADYKNSGQGIGYGVVLDVITASMGKEHVSSYDVLYLPYLTKSLEWHPLPFSKLHSQRAQWIQEVFLDKAMIVAYQDANYWPMHGESCMAFYRRCEFYDMCNMSEKFLLGKPIENIDVKEDKVEKDGRTPKYQFNFHVNQLIEAQLERETTA